LTNLSKIAVKGDSKMRKNNEEEKRESGKSLTLTMILTKILLLAVAVAAFWLAQLIIMPGNQLNGFLRGFNLW